MKKRIASLVFAAIICLGLYFAVPIAVYADIAEIQVVLDGVKVEFDTPPQIINARTMVPMRAVFEALGAYVEWNEEAESIIAHTEGGDIIKLIIGSADIYINDNIYTMDIAPQIIDDRTLVPVRFVAVAMGYEVSWDEYERTVLIISPIGAIEQSENRRAQYGETEALAGLITISGNTLYIYRVDIFMLYDGEGNLPGLQPGSLRAVNLIAMDDEYKMAEFGLTIYDMPSGHYIRQREEERRSFEFSEEAIFTFVDLYLLFGTAPYGNRLYSTNDLDEFLLHLYTSFRGLEIPRTIPFFIEVKDGKVISLTEEFSFTL